MLKYQKAGKDNGFVAHGLGCKYIFDEATTSLGITALHAGEEIRSFPLPKRISNQPRSFVELLEKATHIKALTLSNNQTTNLSITVDSNKMLAMIENAFDLALQAYDLHQENFQLFAERATPRHKLEDLQIKNMTCTRSGTSYYRTYIKSESGYDIVIRDIELPKLLSKTSHAIVRDLIPHEFGKNENVIANQLLLLSSQLSILSRIINSNFDPAMQIISKNFSRSDRKSTA